MIDENNFVKEHISDRPQSLVQQEVARESVKGTTSVPQASVSNHGNVNVGDRSAVTPALQALESLTHYPSVDPTIEEATSLEDGGTEHGDQVRELQTGRYPKRERKPPHFFQPGSVSLATVLAACEPSKFDPTTVDEALSQNDAADWHAAIESELDALRKHETWEIVDRPKGIAPLSTRFVFLRKRNEQGTVIRHKARLVVRGFLRGDVNQTFASVLDYTTVRACIAIAIQRGYALQQLDVRAAFLHGKLDEEVYIESPKGLSLCEPHQILKLRRGLYGLKQAPRLWQDKWNEVMGQLGFCKLMADECVYRRVDVCLPIYVDDILLMGKKEGVLQAAIVELAAHLDIKVLRKMRSFLGVLFLRDEMGAWLSQSHYILQVARRFGMEKCRTVTVSMCTSTIRDVSEGSGLFVERKIYQELLVCLLFIATRTRLDISASVSILCGHASKPQQIHWIALKRVLRYLMGTLDYVLRFSKVVDAELKVYCDADWASDHSDRKSTTGVLLQLGHNIVAWKTQKQHAVALSTTEAEFMSLSEGTKMTLWLRKLLEELCNKQDGATIMFEDNQGAIVWSTEGVRHAKHVSMRRNFVLDNVKNGTVKVVYAPTSKMTADILTKPVKRITFESHRTSMGVLAIEE